MVARGGRDYYGACACRQNFGWLGLRLIGFGVMMACYPTSYAAEPHQSEYTLHQVIELAFRHNPVMNGAEALVEQSEGQRTMAGAYLNPTITGSAGRGSIRDPSTGVSITERTITVEQPLEWPGKRAARRRAADAGLAGALAGMEETKVLVRTDVKGAFFQLLFAQQDAQLARDNLKTVDDLVKVVSARVGTQEAPKFELVKATVEIQKSRKDLARADNALLVARAKLNTVTGKALGQRFTIQGTFESIRTGLDLPSLMEQGLKSPSDCPAATESDRAGAIHDRPGTRLAHSECRGCRPVSPGSRR